MRLPLPISGEPPRDADPNDARSAFLARMTEFYARVDDEIRSRAPVCTNRGLCCKFNQYGHRLYVSAVELAYFLDAQAAAGIRPVTEADGCPYQIDGRCTARGHRPLGCRIFFCDPASQDWQGPAYEQALAELKRIGEEFGIQYEYREWLTALRSADEVRRDAE